MEYSSGHIYKIICSLDSNFVYIGSTFTTLRQRWSNHKKDYKQYLKDGSNNMSTHKYYTKYGIENFKIILIKSYKVIRESQRDNTHLKVYEQLWLNKTKKSVNIPKAFNPLAKLDKLIRDKEYYENNKEKISEKGKEYYLNNKEKKKEYHENNKEKRKEKRKEHYNHNKEKINEKITCQCGTIIIKRCLSTHIKTKKHLKLIQNK